MNDRDQEQPLQTPPPNPTNEYPAVPIYPTYEYLTVPATLYPQQMLTELGERGWYLCGVTPQTLYLVRGTP